MYHRISVFKKNAVVIAVLSVMACTSALAIQDGIPVDAGTVIANPFSPGKTIQAWQLVGNGSCSAIRISKEWVMAAAHCGYPVTFTSELGSAPVDRATCSDSVAEFGYDQNAGYRNDIHICRLANLGTLTEPASYPVLAVMPKFDVSNATKFGGMLIRGMAKPYATAPLQVALVDLNGMPLGFAPATVDPLKNVPYVVSGDSGGGAYWIPPDGSDPALVGVLSTIKGAPGGIALVPWYFTSDNLKKISAYMIEHGQVTDQKLTLKTTDNAYYQVPAAAPAPSMTSKPQVFSTGGSGGAITVSWTPPSSSIAIDSFKVTLGQNGALKQTQSVTSGLTNSAKLIGLEGSANSTVCITPVNTSGGAATAAYAIQGKPVLLGCLPFDNRMPGTVAPTPLTSTLSAASGGYVMSTSWVAPTNPNVAIRAYRVFSATSYQSGPKRTATRDVSTLTASSLVTAGSTICMSVAAISQIGVVGAYSTAQCKTAQ